MGTGAATDQFQVWFWRGRGMEAGPSFSTLSAAIEYVEDHRAEGSFGIFTPTGQWHAWSANQAIMLSPVSNHLVASS